MTEYYVNTTKTSTGEYEVHKEGCFWLTRAARKEFLGSSTHCHPAVQTAEAKGYRPADGCAHCCPDCHRR